MRTTYLMEMLPYGVRVNQPIRKSIGQSEL